MDNFVYDLERGPELLSHHYVVGTPSSVVDTPPSKFSQIFGSVWEFIKSLFSWIFDTIQKVFKKLTTKTT